MSKVRSVPFAVKSAPPQPERPAAPTEPPAIGLRRDWVRFWFTPVDPIGLHALRVLTGLLLLAYLLPFAGQLDALFGLGGWFDRRAYSEAARLTEGLPQPIGWSFLFLCGSSSALLYTAYGLSLGVLVLFTLGLWTRLTAVLTWVIVVSFTASPALYGDADVLLGILAFYLMIGYVLLGQREARASPASRLLGPADTWLFRRAAGGARRTSVAANVALRLLQVHLALVVFTMGLHKLQFGDWWAGVAYWFPLNPPFVATVSSARQLAQDVPFLMGQLSIAAYATLAWEIGFPLFAWRPRWRLVLLGGGAICCLGTAFLYQLPTFGPALLIGCFSYLTAAEWQRLAGWLARLPGLRRLPAGRGEAMPPSAKREVAQAV